MDKDKLQDLMSKTDLKYLMMTLKNLGMADNKAEELRKQIIDVFLQKFREIQEITP